MKAVLFDLDGTLIDTAADFIRIIQDMCRAKPCALVDAEIIRSQVSEGARAMVQLVYPELDAQDPVFLAHRQRFLDVYGEDIAVDTALFADMNTLLERLENQQIPWGIVTNKPRWLSEAYSKHSTYMNAVQYWFVQKMFVTPNPILNRCIWQHSRLPFSRNSVFMLVIIRVILMPVAMRRCTPF